jgi:hypothetical protein
VASAAEVCAGVAALRASAWPGRPAARKQEGSPRVWPVQDGSLSSQLLLADPRDSGEIPSHPEAGPRAYYRCAGACPGVNLRAMA